MQNSLLLIIDLLKTKDQVSLQLSHLELAQGVSMKHQELHQQIQNCGKGIADLLQDTSLGGLRLPKTPLFLGKLTPLDLPATISMDMRRVGHEHLPWS